MLNMSCWLWRGRCLVSDRLSTWERRGKWAVKESLTRSYVKLCSHSIAWMPAVPNSANIILEERQTLGVPNNLGFYRHIAQQIWDWHLQWLELPVVPIHTVFEIGVSCLQLKWHRTSMMIVSCRKNLEELVRETSAALFVNEATICEAGLCSWSFIRFISVVGRSSNNSQKYVCFSSVSGQRSTTFPLSCRYTINGILVHE